MSKTPRCPKCGSCNTRTSLKCRFKRGLGYAGEIAIGLGIGYFLDGAGVELFEDVSFHDKVAEEFTCPNCGYKWSASGEDPSVSNSSQPSS